MTGDVVSGSSGLLTSPLRQYQMTPPAVPTGTKTV